MAYLKPVFAILLVIYFIYRSDKHPIFFLGIPFLMSMPHQSFMNTLGIFWRPASLDSNFHVFLWVVLAYLYGNQRRQVKNTGLWGPKKWSKADKLLLVFGILILFHISVCLVNYSFPLHAENSSLRYLMMIAGFFLIRGIFSKCTSRELFSFLDSLLYINAVIAIMGILNQNFGLHFYVIETIGELERNSEVLRIPWIESPFLFFGFAYLLACKKFNVKNLMLFSIYSLAIINSLSRGAIFTFFAVIACKIVIEIILSKQKLRLFKRNMGVAVVIFLLILVFIGVFSKRYNYFDSRVQSTITNTVKEQTLKRRLDSVSETLDLVLTESAWLGFGFDEEKATGITWNRFYNKAWDMIYVTIIYRFGLVGLVLYFLIYIALAIGVIRYYRYSSGNEKELAQFLLLYLLADFLLGNSSSGILNVTFSRMPIALWYLALYSSLYAIKLNARRLKVTYDLMPLAASR